MNEKSKYITVIKNGVVHKFVRFDTKTDNFTENVFQDWQNSSFAIFEQVKDPDGIAIDLGAWIGTTAIWLSSNFKHVVAVECDKVSLTCLNQNVEASGCKNVIICDKPIADSIKDVIFGPRWGELNLSVSCMKDELSSPQDYVVLSTTFEQMLIDYVYNNKSLETKKISFIKCDIEGGEEEILEDVLHFAYNNKCPVYMSFHVHWWKSKSIKEFEYLFKYFKTGIESDKLSDYLEKNTFSSILFEPLDAGVLVKRQ